MTADLQNGLISRIFSVFFEWFFAQNNSKRFVKWILTCFLQFRFLTQSKDFAKATAFTRWPILKMVSFLEYLVFFERIFAQNNSKRFVECILTRFLQFEFLTESEDFAKAVSFA